MKDLSNISLLIDCYGGLLTKKQLEYLTNYYFEDLSLNEIAENNNVSKNAVYDSIKKSEKELKNYESILKLIENSIKRQILYHEIKDEVLKNKLLETEVIKHGK